MIVHGGGPQIGKELNKLKLEFKFKNSIKLTTPKMINYSKILDEKINIEIKNLIDSWGSGSLQVKK